MTPTRSLPTSRRRRRQTVPSSGCLSGFLLPPFVALCFGVLLAFVTLGQGEQRVDVAAAPATGSNGLLAPLFTPEVQFWAAQIVTWSAEQGLDPNLAATVMQIESCGHPGVRSSAGATGLFQVMPYHFQLFEDAYDPATNARRGLDYLRRALERANGDPRLALAGYNGGLGVIGRAEARWPAETRRYVYWGSGIYADAQQNASHSVRLNEWLDAGGASLCKKARQYLGLR
ncbi:MAG: hypothetical protein DDG60_14190 [Anaerolineae bacterium]|nr:MAG: hypothetical protein DDG60_14190 [Anaerolineae bacterium]